MIIKRIIFILICTSFFLSFFFCLGWEDETYRKCYQKIFDGEWEVSIKILFLEHCNLSFIFIYPFINFFALFFSFFKKN